MDLDHCYALLDARPGAPLEELKRAHRDLTKVWHPDRFAGDPFLRRKAEEKLKAINEAYQTLLAAHEGGRPEGRRGRREPHPDPETGAAQAAARRRQEVVRNRMWAFSCAAAALFVLMRRPTAGGLLIALLLCCGAVVFFLRMRAASRS